MIRIVNLRNYKPQKGEVLIKVDRSSPVGNPYFMSGESQRHEVCDRYEEYFDTKIKDKDSEFMDYLRYIYKLAIQYDIALGCWCYPKRCHAEKIKQFIEKFINK